MADLRDAVWVPTHSPCRIASVLDPLCGDHVVYCETHGRLATVGDLIFMTDEQRWRALAPVRQHVEENTPGRAPVTLAEAGSWGWWDPGADAEGCHG
ncbi:MAG TPA: hypothetical protein VMY76_00625 [Gemmatimonadales bacterium]|nr:hypothetical protein [Gemmatimonadales bacterium]